ncbi:MAG TPA: polyprenyl synthetase family protein [Chloroflexota bacterium]|nr:polyprenyl synthetase family protein [Chloroflexota bacterium]
MQHEPNLAAMLAHYAEAVGAEMKQALDAYDAPRDYYDMMRYHLGWVNERFEPVDGARGKGLRAGLLLLIHELLGGVQADALPLAAAVELLHNFSLVHDDIEDGSMTRRHRATVWSIWGVGLGINLGDGLFEVAHLARYRSPLKDTAPATFIDILRRFELTTLAICEGQHSDMSFESRAEVTIDEYLRMVERKTAALISGAAWIGARAAGAPPDIVEAAGEFGRRLGLAFQIQDDILGIWGDEAVTGKSATSDIATRKKTLPVLLAMEHGRPEPRQRLRALYARADDATAEILALLAESDARERAQSYLQEHRAAAMVALQQMQLTPAAGDLLRQVAALFIDRTA